VPEPPRPDPPDGTLKVTVFGRYPPVRWSNVLWFDCETSGSVALSAIDAVTDGVVTAFQTHFIPLMNTNTLLEGGQGVFWDASGEREVTADASAAGEDDSGTALPANCALGISWKTAGHYRGGHPRTYMVGLNQTALEDVTRFSGAAQTAWQSAAAGFRAEVNALDSTPTITAVTFSCMSFVRAGNWRTPPVHLHITGESVDSRLDTQRRRLGPDVPA
jgi:hypothetical protein